MSTETVSKIQPAPWDRHDWRGELISADGVGATDFTREDVEQVIWRASSPPGWDGDTAGVVRLKDKRYVGWEAFWDATGDGFSRDAYGGTSDIVFGTTQAAVEAYISEKGKALARVIDNTH